MAGVFCLLFFAAGAPSPLYGIYRAQLRFSATTLTAVFAIYALVLLLTLLVFGSVSDYLGRRAVILAALGVTAGACAVFLVWWLLLGASVAAAAGILAMPEPGTRRAGVLASLRPRVGVPRQARGTFATAVPCLIAVWALSGLYQSLGPKLAAQVTGSADLLWGGLMVFLLTGVAATAMATVRGLTPRTAMLAGCLVLLAGLVVTFAAIATTTAAAFLAGTAVAGVGTGLALLGVNRTLIPLAAPGQRARLIAAIFIISYLGFSIPVVIAGVATAHVGLHRTALAYCVAIAALLAVAAGRLMFRRSGIESLDRGAGAGGPGPAVGEAEPEPPTAAPADRQG